MADDVGGRPFQDGWEPDDDRGADEEFASVVLDEAFVRAAEFHEPSAVERLLAAAQARAEADAARSRAGRHAPEEEHELWDELYSRRHPEARAHGAYDPDDPDAPSPYGRHGGTLFPYHGRARWHRPVAWLLALLIGIGMVALALSAVSRGSGGGSRPGQAPQPASTGIDAPRVEGPDDPADGGDKAGGGGRRQSAPPVSAVPRTR
ncbi:hypothetical protein [Streptomyces sp. NRRL F-5126]|uniref:SCO2584 family spore wall biosynthesis protein n=1 Tax=Streptomyces sp. NRRL F-5126 TaxID=1463857 RepID=UPI0004CBFD0A|nr:hypothetical protein [Streptomyces sp. NRRL F-5126]